MNYADSQYTLTDVCLKQSLRTCFYSLGVFLSQFNSFLNTFFVSRGIAGNAWLFAVAGF
jgi:hypothetical protein